MARHCYPGFRRLVGGALYHAARIDASIGPVPLGAGLLAVSRQRPVNRDESRTQQYQGSCASSLCAADEALP